MKQRNIAIKLNMLYLIFFGAAACYYPFLTPFFQSKGLSYSQIGILLSLNSIMAIIFQPLWGYITDKALNKKTSLIIAMMSSGLLILNFIYARNFYFISLSVAIFMIFLSGIGPIMDAYCYEIIALNKKLQYGRIRLMGSMGYATAALLIGFVIKNYGNNSPFVIYLAFMCLCVIIIKSIDYKGQKSSVVLNLKSLGELLKDKKFIWFLISVMTLNISMGTNSSYISVLIEKTGGNISNLGFLWFVIAMSELPAFFFGNKLLKKFGTLNLFYLSIALFSLRLFLDSVAINYYMVIAIQAMQAITFPLYLMATLQFINENIKQELRTSSIAIYSAMGGGLGGFIGNMSGGMLLEIIDVFTLYKVLAIIAIVALVIALKLKKL